MRQKNLKNTYPANVENMVSS